MNTRHNSTRDPFRFSLRGLAATAFGGVPYAVGDNGINAVWDEKLRKAAAQRTNSAAADAPAPLRRTVFGVTG
ncbi:MAG TPA: hypothetical protein VLS87_08295 [Woeseiaceae bacterium]|nr:hypothetical protein [Woeseiaceae bacterium]